MNGERGTANNEAFKMNYTAPSMATAKGEDESPTEFRVRDLTYVDWPDIYLETGVHLAEEELLRRCVHQKLHRPGTDVAHRLGRANGGFSQLRPGGLGDPGSGSLFENLLVPAVLHDFRGTQGRVRDERDSTRGVARRRGWVTRDEGRGGGYWRFLMCETIAARRPGHLLAIDQRTRERMSAGEEGPSRLSAEKTRI